MPYISRLKLKNFKRFKSLDISFHSDLNILVGNNASGKSTILQAINTCLTANRKFVEEENLKFLFNSPIIEEFKNLPEEERVFENLPIVEIEVFLEDFEVPEYIGGNNSEQVHCSGLKMKIEPNPELGLHIKNIIELDDFSFPFEFYISKFTTFQGGTYTKRTCPIGFLFVDHSAIGEVSATNNYIRGLFQTLIDNNKKNELSHNLRSSKLTFNAEFLNDLTEDQDQNFVLRTDRVHSISQSLSLETNGVDIMHEGKGAQSLIKTKFALEKRTDSTHILLIEEPENHLSHSGMMELLGVFNECHEGQTIISTHSSMIASGLDLNNILIIGDDNEVNLSLKDLEPDTSEFFKKAPDHLLLEFILSKKALLVEGSAEYILFPVFYKLIYGRSLFEDRIHLISVGGVKFKRYLSVSSVLAKRTAFVQDNDGKTKEEVLKQYLDGQDDESSLIVPELQHIGLHDSPDESTLEKVLYANNENYMEDMFGGRVKTNTVLQYMVANKTKVALELANKISENPDGFVIPDYIKETFEWLQN